MKCRSSVFPLWKKPAANGPWYQVRIEPGHPGGQPGLRAGGEVDEGDGSDGDGDDGCGTRPLSRGSCRGGIPHGARCFASSAPRGTPATAPPAGEELERASPKRVARPAMATPRDRDRVEQTESAEQLGDPDQEREREDGRGQASRGTREPGQQARAQARRPQPGEAGEQGQLGDAKQVAARTEHLAAPQQPRDLLQLGDPQQLRDRDVDEPAGRQTGPQRDDLAGQAAAERLVEQVPDDPADAGEGGGGDRDPAPPSRKAGRARGRRTRGAGSPPGRRPRRWCRCRCRRRCRRRRRARRAPAPRRPRRRGRSPPGRSPARGAAG